MQKIKKFHLVDSQKMLQMARQTDRQIDNNQG